TLEQRLADTRADRADIARLVRELAACLSAAHLGGVVHRDIKPSNIMIRTAQAGSGRVEPVDATSRRETPTPLLGPDEQLVVGDFGLARALGLTDLTVAGGTDGFMAPEQRTPSTSVDERADIYAATAVVAQAWTGSISSEVVDRLGSSDDPVDRALARGLAEDRDERPADATEWERELLASLGDPDPTDGSGSRGPRPPARVEAPETPRASRLSTRATAAAAVAGLGVAVIVAAILIVLTRDSGDDEAAATETVDAETADGADANTGSTAQRVDEIAAFGGDWSTSGSDIVTSNGQPIRIRGVNWFGFESDLAVAHGLWARNHRDLVALIAELGFNTIRIPFSSSMLDPDTMPVDISYELNPDLEGLTSLEVLDEIVDDAGRNGLAVILDRHALGADDRAPLWYDDDYPAERMIEDWELLATRYRDRPNVIGADLYNAPHGTACWGCGDPERDWRLAAEATGDAIHRIAPGWLIFVAGVERPSDTTCGVGEGQEPCAWRGADVGGAIADPVRLTVSEAKVVYATQDYGSSVFEQPWFDDPSFPSNMPAIWDRWWGELEATDAAPVLLSGFGTVLDGETNEAWLGALLAYVDERDVDFAFWALNPNSDDTGGLLEADWFTVDEDKMDFLRRFLDGPFR
ncbi:MAG: cellulase family glycosylhydrolase, partial [Actinomycetota bacterium]